MSEHAGFLGPSDGLKAKQALRYGEREAPSGRREVQTLVYVPP
jgi:hypothetical protein